MDGVGSLPTSGTSGVLRQRVDGYVASNNGRLRYTYFVSAVGETPVPSPSTLGRYELISRIGQGGMAEVQLAIQRGPAGFEKLVVVKLVHANLATQKSFVDMLLDEARMAALVKHPNVVDIYDLGESEGRYFIAMEYLEGEALLSVLRAGREGKRLDPLSTARLISDTAEGLEAAHELRSMAGEPIELVHHDVSLGNIVVLYNGQAKLVDFGVAKATMSSNAPTRVQGKYSYMAPEKLRGSPGDRRSDLWSLGCVLWESLTLRRLFKGGNDNDTIRQVLEHQIMPPSLINPDVPVEFDAIVMKALDRDPDKRYATAKEMAQDLEEVLRVHQYGGRNDLIARYMQATFHEHINARKKLLQEVSSKGRASPAVLEAAFTEDPGVANPVSEFNFAVRFKRATGELTAEGTPAVTPRPVTTPFRVPPTSNAVAFTELPSPKGNTLPRERSPSSPGHITSPVLRRSSRHTGQIPLPEFTVSTASDHRKNGVLVLAGIALLLLGVAITFLIMRKGDDIEQPGAAPRKSGALDAGVGSTIDGGYAWALPAGAPTPIDPLLPAIPR